MLATITAALAMLYAAATTPVEATVRRIHEATISIVSLDRQMVGRLASTVVPDFMYLEYRSLYLEVKASGAAWRSRGTRDPTGAAVAGRAARRDTSPHHAGGSAKTLGVGNNLKGLSYFSCFPVGLWMQPEPLEVEPHQMHLLPPGPWRCLRVGEWMQPEP